MNKHELINIWKKEEHAAHIHGWDFSHIEGRYTEETDLPWDYRHIIRDYLKPEMKLLDIDTGGGEFLFPSVRAHTATISDAGPLAALRRMGYQSGEQSLHGFRAIASTLLNESGEREAVIEAQLAHKDPDATRRAYNRAAYLEERRGMMQRWADRIDQLRAGAN